MDGVKLEFETDALKRIAELAIKKEIGARGLRSIIEKAMQNVMFSIPDRTDAKKVVVTSGVIDALLFLCSIIFSNPEKAPPQINNIFDVSISTHSACGCFLPPWISM